MKQHNIRPIILCGGSGTRLWPVSRKSMPKQFTRLTGERTMLQDTILRLEDAGCSEPIFITTEDYRFTVASQVQELGVFGYDIVIEPEGRDTAPAICAAAEILYEQDPEALMLVVPSDHQVTDVMEFTFAIAKATERARKGKVITFGIRPDGPETGYGYIKLCPGAKTDDDAQPFLNFVEKPDRKTAQKMVESGRYLWNSGMFMFSVATVRKEFGRCAPDVRAAVRRGVRTAKRDLDFLRLGPDFQLAPKIAFDHAVMEKVKGEVVPLKAGWADLGSWRNVWANSPQDADGVALQGSTVALGCSNSLLFSDDGSVEVVGLGLKNIAAVATRDAVLVADLDDTQAVSQVVARLKADEIEQAEEFPKNFRPWGHYETLSLGPRFQVKSIVVKPGGKLSLQSHVHRAEHWVVVEGTAKVTIGIEEKLIAENQSVYISLGETHRLENTGKVPLQLIEVQTGAYLGEDDIVRYEDIYERV